MSDKLVSVPLNDSHHPNLNPTKEVNEYNRVKQTQMQDTIKEIRKGFKPAVDTELVAPTRFSAKPVFGSTFVNF